MEIEPTDLQEQVDQQIDIRLQRICQAEARKVNFVNGRWRKKMKPVTFPQEVNDLLSLRQDLYNGRDPEEISAIITNGAINYKFLNS